MSMSTEHGGGSRRPSATKAVAGGKPNLSKDSDEGASPPAKASPGRAAKATAAKATAAKATAAKATAAKATAKKGAAKAGARPAAKAGARPAAKAGARPAAKFGGGAGKRAIAPVRVSQGRNWGPIALTTVVILISAGIIGFAGWKVYETDLTIEDKVGRIDGVVNWRTKEPKLVKGAQHEWGPLKYAQNPPVAGKHNFNIQNCMGDVYDAPIANEHVIHSMEHGAVWLAYNPAKVNKEQVDKLAALVRGKEFSLMSPIEGLDKAVSVQAWGFQLKVDNPGDKRIAEFVKVTRKNAGIEPGAPCSGGITETGTTPRDLGKDQQQQQQQPPPAQPGG